MAAVKAMPLGQTDGQRILLSLGGLLPALTAQAQNLQQQDLARPR
ncbi:MAG: hypothetical protein EXR30_06595 [Betaproteobacteria bacterium]|nr:hypothetical protein [Betaproteobacteria bacterium]MSQ89260.1 hypothetical protein [Betaproteobacteria bacterium]